MDKESELWLTRWTWMYARSEVWRLRRGEYKCQWVVFLLCPQPAAPFDLYSGASHHCAAFSRSLFKAKPCSLVDTAQRKAWLTLCHLWCHVTLCVQQWQRKALNHFGLSADCRVSARKCSFHFSSYCLKNKHQVLVLVFSCTAHKFSKLSHCSSVNHHNWLSCCKVVWCFVLFFRRLILTLMAMHR